MLEKLAVVVFVAKHDVFVGDLRRGILGVHLNISV